MTGKRKVAIVGGGMAGLTAAWQLSQPGWRHHVASITVYQRGGQLGGKGASTRGVHGRIQEHGLHVWLGYYHNAFRLLREVYDELDRPTTAPGCPIQTFADAFLPADDVGVGGAGSLPTAWMARFPPNGLDPGAGELNGRAFTVPEFVRQAVNLLTTLSSSLDPPPEPRSRPTVVFSGSAEPPRPASPSRPTGSLARLGGLVRQAELASLVAGVQGLALLERMAPARLDRSATAIVEQLRVLRRDLLRRVERSETASQLRQVLDLVLGCAQGAIEDGLLGDEGFGRIDHLDFRDWLAPRVDPETLRSPLVTGLYDLVFAYEGGDHGRPRFAAGLGLFLAGRLFLEYRGSIFQKMRAGMGDVVFAPLYQALRARGVRFEFFHRLAGVELDPETDTVATLVFGVQANLADPDRGYEPLVDVRGLPTFPEDPPAEQFTTPPPVDADWEWADRTSERTVRYRHGTDFDTVVLAVSLGILPDVAAPLIERFPAWRAMVDNVSTVATEALQLWTRPTEAELGWHHPGATVSGFDAPFDTYSSMSHLLDLEDWPANLRPRAIGYFCSALPDDFAQPVETAREAVRRHTADFLAGPVERVWPGVTAERVAEVLAEDGVYTRANVDRSDRYVQSVPGSGAHRLRADQSGCPNLVLAGDWTNCGLNAGCVEAAVMSGVQAANAVLGRPLTDGLAGRWYGLDDAGAKIDEPAFG